MHKEIRLVAIKESIRFEGKHNLQTKAMIALFGLFAEVERDLIAERTKGRTGSGKGQRQTTWAPQGGLRQIEAQWQGSGNQTAPAKKVSKASIARIVEVSPMTLDHFIRTRKLQPSQRQPG